MIVKLACLLVLLSFCFLAAANGQVNITTWQNSLAHTGNNSQETILNPQNVKASGSFGLLFTQTITGQAYAQPLYVSGLKMADGSIHNVVFVATEHCSVSAFDADSNSGSNANPLWSDTLIPTGFTAGDAADGGSSDILPEIGLTATPVIDPTSQTIYLVTKVKNTSDATYHQYLHALDLTSGAEKFNGPVEITTTFRGTGSNSDTFTQPGTFQFSAIHEHARAALALYNGLVYITYASHGDVQPYHGEILAYDASTLQLVKQYVDTPNGDEGGIWQGGAGPAVDGSGNLFVMTGNGSTDSITSPYSSDFNWAETILKLPTTGIFDFSQTNTLNFFTPSDSEILNNQDEDLGSGGLLLLPDQTLGTHPHLLIGGGKEGILYVLDRDNLGGAHNPNLSLQEYYTGYGIFCTPAYCNGYIYYAGDNGPLQQRAIGYDSSTGNYINPTGYNSNIQYNSHGSSVFISSNGNTNGVVWIIQSNISPSELDAYNATNVSGDPIYSFTTTVPGNPPIQATAPKFGLPIVANGKVYLTAFDNSTTPPQSYLFTLGLLAGATTAPAAPTNLTASSSSSAQITLNWTDNSTNESGFKIFRATQADGPFTQISLVGANITSYSDSGLSSQTTYYYAVSATNNIGDSSYTNVANTTTFTPYTPNGLVAYWNFDEGSGTIANDATGNGHNGTLNGEIGWTKPYIGHSALNIHGKGNAVSNVTVSDAPSLDFSASQSFTLSAWIQPAGLRNADEAFIAKSRETGNYYGIWINSSNQWAFRGPGGDVVGPTATLNWTHVAVVQDGPANTRKIYVNGVLANTGTAQAANGTGNLLIGQANGVTQPFPGNVDEVRLYNRALAASEITTLMGPPVLQAVSRLTHGAAGTFDLVLPTNTANVLIEPRQGSPLGSYNLVLTFSSTVSGLSGTLGLQAGQTGSAVGTVGTIAYDTTGKIVTVPLTGVGSAQRLNLRLSGIQPGNGTADLPINILWGDVNGDGIVNVSDIGLIKLQSLKSLNANNFVRDMNCDGVINVSDIGLTKTLSLKHLP